MHEICMPCWLQGFWQLKRYYGHWTCCTWSWSLRTKFVADWIQSTKCSSRPFRRWIHRNTAVISNVGTNYRCTESRSWLSTKGVQPDPVPKQSPCSNHTWGRSAHSNAYWQSEGTNIPGGARKVYFTAFMMWILLRLPVIHADGRLRTMILLTSIWSKRTKTRLHSLWCYMGSKPRLYPQYAPRWLRCVVIACQLSFAIKYHILQAFVAKGLQVVLIANRGCSGEDNQKPYSYHLGFTDDINFVTRKAFLILLFFLDSKK